MVTNLLYINIENLTQCTRYIYNTAISIQQTIEVMFNFSGNWNLYQYLLVIKRTCSKVLPGSSLVIQALDV